MKKSDYFVTFMGKRYAFNFDRLMELALYSESHQSSEVEITNGYAIDDEENGDDLLLTSKIDRELKTAGNPQNDVIAFEFIKIMIGVLLDNEINKEDEPSFQVAIALNTLLKMGIINEIDEKE